MPQESDTEGGSGCLSIFIVVGVVLIGLFFLFAALSALHTGVAVGSTKTYPRSTIYVYRDTDPLLFYLICTAIFMICAGLLGTLVLAALGKDWNKSINPRGAVLLVLNCIANLAVMSLPALVIFQSWKTKPGVLWVLIPLGLILWRLNTSVLDWSKTKRNLPNQENASANS